jgi:hypothetical protein
MNLYEQNQDDTVTMEITVEEYQNHKEAAEHLLREAEMAQRLAKNPDFIALIMENYFVREPSRLGQLMASGRLNEKQMQEVIQDIRGIASLRVFMNSFIQRGLIAQNELAELEASRKEIGEEHFTN